MLLRRAGLALLACLLFSCRPDTVDLGYRFTAGEELNYRITAQASARWDIGAPGSGSYQLTFYVSEVVNSVDATGADVSVVMTPDPSSIKEDGLPSPGPQRRSFRLRVGPNGEVTEVLEVDGLPATALDADEIAFIGTYRPPLPTEPVRLDDRWEARQKLELASVDQEIVTTGELEGLSRPASAPLARLGFSGAGPLVWKTMLPQGDAVLEGSSSTSSTALFDIDGGFLRSGSSSTTGDFDVTVSPPDQTAPVEGTLHLVLELEIERTAAATT